VPRTEGNFRTAVGHVSFNRDLAQPYLGYNIVKMPRDESIYNLVPEEYAVKPSSPVRFAKKGAKATVTGSTFGYVSKTHLLVYMVFKTKSHLNQLGTHTLTC